MMTRRSSLFVLAGLVSGILVTGDFSLPGQVYAQRTQTEIKQKARQGTQKAVAKWDSLSPEQQQQLQEKWKMTAEQAQAKWDSMTPEQQQQAVARGKSAAQKAQKKWHNERPWLSVCKFPRCDEGRELLRTVLSPRPFLPPEMGRGLRAADGLPVVSVNPLPPLP